MKKPKRNIFAKARRKVVLVFGENEHDTYAIRHLVEGLRSDLKGMIEPRRQPLVLIKNATPEKARSNASRIAQVVRQEMAARDVRAVLAHEDCDAIEPAHLDVAERIETEITNAGCSAAVIAVAPAWEIEAWWMIFPEAVGKVVQGWRDPDDWIGRDAGKVTEAKEKLGHAVQPRAKPRKAPREYEERDSVQIAANIASDGLLGSLDTGRRRSHPDRHGTMKETRSASFEEFRRKVSAIR